MEENPYQPPLLPAEPSGVGWRRPLAKVVRIARVPLSTIMFVVGMIVATATLGLLRLHLAGIPEAGALIGSGLIACWLTMWSFWKLADRIHPRARQNPELPEKAEAR